nr:MAG TPA: hypothetical protein [Caudoviricetes sp.]
MSIQRYLTPTVLYLLFDLLQHFRRFALDFGRFASSLLLSLQKYHSRHLC